MARPTKLTEEVQKKICDAILIGTTYRAAAEYAGVSYDAFNEWMTKNSGKYRQFRHAVDQANAEAQVRLMGNIKKSASDGDWRAAAWILERRFKGDFSPKQEVEHSGDAQSPVNITLHAVDYRNGLDTLKPESDE